MRVPNKSQPVAHLTITLNDQGTGYGMFTAYAIQAVCCNMLLLIHQAAYSWGVLIFSFSLFMIFLHISQVSKGGSPLKSEYFCCNYPFSVHALYSQLPCRLHKPNDNQWEEGSVLVYRNGRWTHAGCYLLYYFSSLSLLQSKAHRAREQRRKGTRIKKVKHKH